jgi:excisionase family DNA binding protein
MQMLTAKEVAVTLNLRLARVYELTREGVLPVVRVGPRQLRYDACALGDWVRRGGVSEAQSVRSEDVRDGRN